MHSGPQTVVLKTEGKVAGGPDSAVASSRSWLIRAALFASTAALLGTSPDDVPHGVYHFRRTVVADPVVLTKEEPNAIFLVTIRADSLGPDMAQSTSSAEVQVMGTITPSDISDEPTVSVKLDAMSALEFRRAFNTSQPLQFEGTCEQPAPNAPCQASLLVELARSDDGELGGALSVEWSLDMTSLGEVAKEVGDTELDPPWTVEIVKQ